MLLYVVIFFNIKTQIFLIKDDVSSYTRVTLVMEPSRSVAFCHVPKVACTAWMLAFAKMNGFFNTSETRKIIFNTTAVHP